MREYGKKTYNVNLDSLKGGKKHMRHSEYTIYTDGSKKEEGTGATNKYTFTASKC